MFVDDSDINESDPWNRKTVEELLQELRQDAQRWAELLQASGGKLELTKCFYFLLIWLFKPDGTPMPTPKSQLPYKLILKDGDSEVEITHKCVSETSVTLGKSRSPDGTTTAQVARLKEKSDSYALLISSETVTEDQATLAYRANCLPSMNYNLQCSAINQQDSSDIRSKAKAVFLTKQGYNCHMA